MGHRERASHSRLLQMPAEILADIVDLLTDDKLSLARLALVNSDCRQLARCCQFAEVHFDYSPQAQLLSLALARGFLPEFEHEVQVAACVRRVTFASQPQFVIGRHRELYESIWGESTWGDAAQSYTQEQQQALREQSREHYELLRRASLLAISVMPNLEALVWADRFTLDPDFFQIVTRSTVQHLKLRRATIDEPWSMEPPLTPATWPIRSLDLNITFPAGISPENEERPESPDGTGSTHPMNNFFSTLFQLCAPTLESLSWTYIDPRTKGPISLGSNLLSFPRLRQLHLERLDLDDMAALSFLSAPLRSLDLSEKIWARLGAQVPSSGPFRDLQSFIVPFLPTKSGPCKRIADFLVQNKHVDRLYIHEHDKAHDNELHLDRYIIPALASHDFSSLRSLSLAWGGGSLDGSHDVHVPKASLATIGTLVSLERLSLCAGLCADWRHQWLVDHDELRAHFGQLRRLRKLALVHDTYPIPSPGYDAERYYSVQLNGPQEGIDAEARPELDITEDFDDWVGLEGFYGEEEIGISIRLWERAHQKSYARTGGEICRNFANAGLDVLRTAAYGIRAES